MTTNCIVLVDFNGSIASHYFQITQVDFCLNYVHLIYSQGSSRRINMSGGGRDG